MTTTTENHKEQSRDAYGFAISKENKQPKDWKEVLRKEEEERQIAWHEFLRRGLDGVTPPKKHRRKEEEEEEEDSFDAVRAVLALIRGVGGVGEDDDDNENDKTKKEEKSKKKRNNEFDAKRRKELEMLVNNGLPMSQRAKLWEIFANVPRKRKKGLYDDLVRRCQDDTFEGTVEQNSGASDNNKVCLRETLENRNALFEPEAQPILSERNGSPPKDGNSDTHNNKEVLPTSEDDNDDEFELKNNIHNHHVQSFADAKAQVEKDLPRTFPAHPLLDGVGRDALRRVLLAYARYNPKVGYCQGLNFLAGLLLLLMPEESAFYVLGTIVEDILPGYFVTKQMLAPSVDQKILRVFVNQKLPTLLETLDTFNIPLSAITLNWFLCLFVNCLPWETALRVWDVLLFKRDRTVLFQVTLALLESPSILKVVKEPASDVSALATALQSAVTEAFDASALMMSATLGNADVTMHKIEQLARKHKKAVAKEIFGADYHQFISMSMSFAFTNTAKNYDIENADSKKLGEMFEKWCTPWRERKHQQSTKNNKKEEMGSLMTTPELEDDNLNEVGALNEKVSKVLTFDETDASLVETPMTCDSVQSSSASLLPADKKNKYNETVATKQKKGKEKDGDQAESAPTTTFGTSFKEWMSTARKGWEFKKRSSASASSSKDVEVNSSSTSAAAAAPASSKDHDDKKYKVVEEQTSKPSVDAALHARLEKLERDAKEKDNVIQKLQKRIEALEGRLLLPS